MKIKRLIGGNLESNGYIINCAKGRACYVIDPGYEAKKYIRELESMGLDPIGILLTHHHYDHVGAVEGIAKRFGCPVYLHREDCDQYRKDVDVLLEDGMELTLGEEKLRVIHTPGHTRGSVCYYSEKSKVVFTGDTIFNVDLGRTDLADGSGEQMRDSICNIISKWSNDITIYPGHGDPATMKYVRQHNQEFLALCSKPETIETERMILRGFTPEDAGDLYEYAKNPNVGPHGGWKPHENVEESLNIIKTLFLDKYHIWAMTVKKTGEVIGSVGYETDTKRPETGCMELGYAMSEDHWGKGLMTEAAKAVIRYGFETMGLPMISIYHNPSNSRSKRVVEKCGFCFEGTMRRAYRIYNGEIRDVACYSMYKEEWEKECKQK